jgi:hypothetical protein
MATWKAIRSSRRNRNQDNQNRIEQAFKAEWLHGHIFGEGEAAISWRLLPPCTFSISLMIEGAVASLLVKGSPLHIFATPSSKWFFVPRLPSGSPEITKVETLTTLRNDYFLCRPPIEMRFKAIL